MHPPALAAAAASFGADRLVLGTDFPYEDAEVFLRAVGHIADPGLTPEEVTMVLGTDAANLPGLSLTPRAQPLPPHRGPAPSGAGGRQPAPPVPPRPSRCRERRRCG
ncbi:amidohydrolase family protein [Streptomyces mirabilis]